MPTYEVLSLDVWGNASDGYEVNDQHRAGQVYIQPTEDDLGIVLALIRDGFLNEEAESHFNAGGLSVSDEGEGYELAEQEEELDEEGNEVDGGFRPFFQLNEVRLTYDGGFPFWKTTLERFELKNSDPHLVEVTAFFIDAKTGPVLEFRLASRLPRARAGHAPGHRTPQDIFQFWFKNWAHEDTSAKIPLIDRRPTRKAGPIGFDPWTSDELVLTAQQMQDCLVALDKAMESQDELVLEGDRFLAQSYGPQGGYAYEFMGERWNEAPNDAWDNVVVGKEDFGEEVGVVVIDGHEMRVWKAAEPS